MTRSPIACRRATASTAAFGPAAVGSGIKNPGFTNSMATHRPGSAFGNPNLKPERSEG
jgi:outer membrane receptor protein involved in Fe transport